MRTSRIVSAVLAMMCVAGSSACGGGGSEAPAEVGPVREFPYTTVWSASPGVDLFGRGAELIRAAEEAAVYTFVVGPEAEFPGYFDAVRDSDIGLFPADHDFRTENGKYLQDRYTWFRNIVDYSADAGRVSATVCTYRVYEDPAKYRSDIVLHVAVRIALVNTSDVPGRAGIVDTDAAARDPRAQHPPSWNVFGTWNIVDYTSFLTNETPQGCIDWWKQEFPMFTADRLGSRALISPPGFVMPTMPVAVQYPEWIGPANVP